MVDRSWNAQSFRELTKLARSVDGATNHGESYPEEKKATSAIRWSRIPGT
eukprot:CAMPEP_0184522906 /NCGR_PEP_ID=MMETSP0198_2-20121128/8562_1 /TAXON_ID=1112570 /ORGANISM="Thraustochytrium sp., Strain LLF1b" /LENGTH=49 /DNA_ID=CAMNT_0026913825 /DNA_START=16 /DNA_END=165 /DNA_ORIENTATION=+